MKKVITLVSLGILTACGGTVYDCDNNLVKEEVLRLQVIGANGDQTLNHSLENIRTSKQDVELGNYHCKANMVTRENAKEQKVEITYSVETSTDGNVYIETNLLDSGVSYDLGKVLILPK